MYRLNTPRNLCNNFANYTSNLLELIHSNLGHYKYTISRGVKKCYITFINDYSRFTKVYILSSKDETIDKFMIYKAAIENQLDRKIMIVRYDRGREYDTTFLEKYHIE